MMNNKLDLTAIILTCNEEIHIRRCLENVCPFSKKVFVIDCFSTDRTCEICSEFLEVEVIRHEWPGNQAVQFNWAIDYIPIDTEWILRLDADEYLLPDLVEELKEELPQMENSVGGLSLSLARAFNGRILKHGIVNNIHIVRIFRKGRARYEARMMDEHLAVDGEVRLMKHQFIDDSRISIDKFISKHNNYASREAVLLLDAEYGLIENTYASEEIGELASAKRAKKAKYARMPLFWRAFGYFLYRYIFKLGFLDGKEGFLWDFMQGWWYRTLVDAKVFEIKKACGEDKEKIKEYLKANYNISLDMMS